MTFTVLGVRLGLTNVLAKLAVLFAAAYSFFLGDYIPTVLFLIVLGQQYLIDVLRLMLNRTFYEIACDKDVIANLLNRLQEAEKGKHNADC